MQIKNGIVSGILRVLGKLKATNIEADSIDLNNALSVSNGGTGATTSAAALTNLGITSGTTDLVAGSSPLASGTYYFVYE